MEMEENVLKDFEEVCKNLPIIYKIDNYGDYLKFYTDILFEYAEDYLNLYLIVEENGICLSDSNEVYRICDGPYDVNYEILEKFANELELDFKDYRFTKFVSLETIGNEINKFIKLKDLICKL